MIARAGAKCFYTNRRPARKCSNKVGVRFCPSPCKHKVEPQYAIPVTDCAAQTVGSGCQTHAAPEPTVRLLSLLPRCPQPAGWCSNRVFFSEIFSGLAAC